MSVHLGALFGYTVSHLHASSLLSDVSLRLHNILLQTVTSSLVHANFHSYPAFVSYLFACLFILQNLLWLQRVPVQNRITEGDPFSSQLHSFLPPIPHFRIRKFPLLTRGEVSHPYQCSSRSVSIPATYHDLFLKKSALIL